MWYAVFHEAVRKGTHTPLEAILVTYLEIWTTKTFSLSLSLSLFLLSSWLVVCKPSGVQRVKRYVQFQCIFFYM